LDRITPPAGLGAVKAGGAAGVVVGPGVREVMADTVAREATAGMAEAVDIAAIARASSRKARASLRGQWTTATATAGEAKDLARAAAEFRADTWARTWSR